MLGIVVLALFGFAVKGDTVRNHHFQQSADLHDAFIRKFGDGVLEIGRGHAVIFGHVRGDPITDDLAGGFTLRGIGFGVCLALGRTPTAEGLLKVDGFKDVPADRMGPRVRYKEAIDEILSEPFDFEKVKTE